MKQIFITVITLGASIVVAAAQSAKEPYNPGLGEFMTATQLRHAKLWFAGKDSNWDLAAYEIDEIKEGLEDAARLHPNFDGVPVADMIRSIINPRIEELERVITAKSLAKFVVAFDELTSSCNSCHAAANKPFIQIQRPTAPPLTNQNFSPAK
jgi:hypothetical protein